MPLFLIFLFTIISFNINAQNITKCKDTYESYENSICLEKLKNELVNKTFTLTLYDTNNTLYAKKNIYISVCNVNSTVYRNTNNQGQIDIKLTKKEIDNCPIKVNIDVKSEYGICKGGNPSIANWNSLDLRNDIYFICN